MRDTYENATKKKCVNAELLDDHAMTVTICDTSPSGIRYRYLFRDRDRLRFRSLAVDDYPWHVGARDGRLEPTMTAICLFSTKMRDYLFFFSPGRISSLGLRSGCAVNREDMGTAARAFFPMGTYSRTPNLRAKSSLDGAPC